MSGLPLGAAASVHCQPCPGATLAFVFICPGRHEANRGYPCAAGTGANLARALVVLNRLAPRLFESPHRADYIVTNAWPVVEYPALTGRSVPSEAEVLQPSNLVRLAAELAEVDRVVACGAQAQAAVRALASQRPGLQAAYARHLSQRSVNMIPGGSTTDQRITRWAELVLAQWEGLGSATPAVL